MSAGAAPALKKEYGFAEHAKRGRTLAYSPELFQQWHKRHANQPFSGEFNEVLVMRLRDSEESDDSRVYAWLVLQAWGNFSDWPVDASGNELRQTACARDTGMDRRRVSEAIRRLVDRSYVELQGRRIMLLDGAKKRRRLSETSGQTTPKSFKTFKRFWLSEHPDKAEELAKAKQALNAIHLEMLSEWKRQSKEAGQNSEQESPEAVAQETELSETSGQTVRDVADKSSEAVGTNERPILIETPELLEAENQSVSQSPTTTEETDRRTAPSFEAEAEDIGPVIEAFEQTHRIALDDRTAHEIIDGCRAAVPELSLTIPEIANAVGQRKVGRSVVNPARFAVSDIPRFVGSTSFRRWLQRARSAAERERQEQIERDERLRAFVESGSQEAGPVKRCNWCLKLESECTCKQRRAAHAG
jgi:hypothetical protein